ncbi:MAG: PHP domain-containing protein [Verrucomicrobiaceae bacterium]|nr:PHP domain-containing protein [Verrucomicrobiaceae bacterium]
MHFLPLFFAALGSLAASASAEQTVLEPRRLHLGRKGAYEWEEFKERAVDAERLELHFTAKSNATEHTLRLWQSQVKQNWPILLNGKKLGSLTPAETPMEMLLSVPAGSIKDGENTLLIEAPANLDDIEVGPIFLVPEKAQTFLSAAKIDVQVTEAETGSSIPCRLTLTRMDGTLQPLLATPTGDVATRVGVVYCKSGHATLAMPAGEYELRAGRGFEWSVALQKITLKAGDAQEAKLTLRREVDTTGWIAADSHIHTLTHSGHGDARIDERMLTIAGEGIELAVATDHNHHTDYAPIAAKSGVAAAFTPIIGNEVTTKHGHFNAFPIQPGAAVVNHQDDEWSRLIPAIRATPGVKVITLNHPRDLHSGFVPLGGLHFNPSTGRHRDAAALDVDALEVITSAAMQTDIFLLYRDWFALLNRGHRIAAIASSDTHDVNRFILGQGRTYVAAKDADPAGLNLDEVWRSYDEGRLLPSLGLLTNMRVGGSFGVGDLATGLPERFQVEITVSGPAWSRVDHIALYANGICIHEEAVEDAARAGIQKKLTLLLPRPAHDVHLVAIATGPGVTAPFWEIPRPYQASSKTFTSRVIGSTNPIWVDADLDGHFSSAYAIAQKLLQSGQDDPAKLTGYDAAVKTQLESLRSAK